MKRIYSFILSLVVILNMATVGYAFDYDSTLYIPTPEEIQLQYDVLKTMQINSLDADSMQSDFLPALTDSILSENSEIQPLLKLGVMSAIAEEYRDLTVLEPASEMIKTDIIPYLKAEDYVEIIDNDRIYTRKEPFIKRQYLRAVTKKSTPCDKIEHPEKNTI